MRPGISERWQEEAKEEVQGSRGRKEVGKEAKEPALRDRELGGKVKEVGHQLRHPLHHGHLPEAHPLQPEERATASSLGTVGTATNMDIRCRSAERKTRT